MLKAPNSDTVLRLAAGAGLCRTVYGINQFMRDAAAQATTNSELPVDHERLKYVTGLLSTQEQGLNTALFGTFLFLMEAPLKWPRGWAISLAGLAGMGIFFAAWRRWIPKCYRKRFGQVKPLELSAKQFAVMFLGLIAFAITLAFFGRPATHYFNPIASSFLDRVHKAISDPSHQVNLTPLSFWLALLLGSLLWRRKIRGQSFCLLSFGLLAVLSIALLPMWHPGAERLEIWKILNAGGLGLTFIALGLYDHIILVRALPKKVAEGGDE